jgi:hypothetical protein
MSSPTQGAKVVNVDTMAIVSDSDRIEIIGRDCDLNIAGSSVDGIVNELFDHVARSGDGN